MDKVHVFDLPSLTQTQGNMYINNERKTTSLPKQDTPLHTLIPPVERMREQTTPDRCSSLCFGHAWKALGSYGGGVVEEPEESTIELVMIKEDGPGIWVLTWDSRDLIKASALPQTPCVTQTKSLRLGFSCHLCNKIRVVPCRTGIWEDKYMKD